MGYESDDINGYNNNRPYTRDRPEKKKQTGWEESKVDKSLPG